MINVLQAFVVVFVLFAISRAFLRLRDRQISLAEFLFWNSVWAAALVVIFIPQVTIAIARVFGIGRGIDIAVYLSIILLFYLVFRIYVKLDQLEQDTTKLVRMMALNEAKSNTKNRRGTL